MQVEWEPAGGLGKAAYQDLGLLLQVRRPTLQRRAPSMSLHRAYVKPLITYLRMDREEQEHGERGKDGSGGG